MRILKQLQRPLLADVVFFSRQVFGVRVVIQQVLDFTGLSNLICRLDLKDSTQSIVDPDSPDLKISAGSWDSVFSLHNRVYTGLDCEPVTARGHASFCQCIRKHIYTTLYKIRFFISLRVNNPELQGNPPAQTPNLKLKKEV